MSLLDESELELCKIAQIADEKYLNNTNILPIMGAKGSLFAHFKVENFIAGIAGGVISTLILHPLDLIKVRLQVDEGTRVKTGGNEKIPARPTYFGTIDAFKKIYREAGIMALYQGVTPNVWGAGASWGLYFLFYNSLKTWTQHGDPTRDIGVFSHMFNATISGIVTLMITNPIWVMKTRLCLQYKSQKSSVSPEKYYNGMIDGIIKVAHYEGFRALYKGFIPGLFGTFHGTVQFATYEQLKRAYAVYYGVPLGVKMGTGYYLAFSAVSKLLAAFVTYPYQVVRSRLQEQHRQYKGIGDVCYTIWKYEGLGGFYKGIIPNLIRVIPASCITFVVYESVVNFLLKSQ